MDRPCSCPFCLTPLEGDGPQLHTGDEESAPGGMLNVETLRCPGCQCELRHEVARKWGRVREEWTLQRPPEPSGAASRGAWRCPRCDKPLAAVSPHDAKPEPPLPAHAKLPSIERSVDCHCRGCALTLKRFESLEKGVSVRGWLALQGEEGQPLTWSQTSEPVERG